MLQPQNKPTRPASKFNFHISKRTSVILMTFGLLFCLMLQQFITAPMRTLAEEPVTDAFSLQRATLPPEWTPTFTPTPPSVTVTPLPTIVLGGQSNTAVPSTQNGFLNLPKPMSEITGKKVIVEFDMLGLRTDSSEDAPIIDYLPRGAVKTILVEALNMSTETIWWYVADGYGWIPSNIDGVPTVRDYSPSVIDQLLAGMDDEKRNDRGNPQLYLQTGWMYYSQQNYGSAISEITIAIGSMEEQNNDDTEEYAWLYSYRGKVYLDMNDYFNAIRNFDKAIELGLEEAAVYNRRAIAYHESEQYWQAKVDYEKAIELNPAYAVVYSNLGRLIDAISPGDPEQLEYYSQAIEADMFYPYSYTNRARYYKNLGDFSDYVVNDYTMALSLVPQDIDVLNDRGIAYSQRQEFQLAMQDFDLAIQIDPLYVNSYVNKGIVHYRMGESQLAAEQWLNAIRLGDPKGDAYYNLGVILQHDWQVEAAIYCYNKALEINPERRDARINRAQIYEMYGGIDEKEIMSNLSVEALMSPLD